QAQKKFGGLLRSKGKRAVAAARTDRFEKMRGAAVVADLEDLRDRSFVTGKSRYVAICDRVTRVRRERRYRGCEPIRIMNSITRKTARMPAQVPSKKLDVVEDNQKCRRRIAKTSVDNLTLDALEILEKGWMY